MGAKQSSPSSNGRTRAYSGSDLPSSTSTGGGSTSRIAPGAVRFSHYGPSTQGASGSNATAAAPAPPLGPRTRSMGGAGSGPGSRAQGLNQSALNIPNSGGTYSPQDSGNSTPEDRPGAGHRLLIGSLPAHLSPHLFGGFKCPVCSKFVSSDEVDLHLVMCLTKPRITYNEDVLTKDAGECAICLEELVQGDTIARLPCLCIYHKGCIDEWFEVNRSCPEHPSD
ncbi:E3 ubiquitin-protein ligase znrf2-like [Erpetoichthys calabaricus]|uniref:RING-type E3 ubiquitin transferase n=1 Tax=Erpetoichthys calabaricus TaxID=27687 RepID=A0A8C4SSI4_ERPCA|nr:E3 ubiquitin-protein ligase znrf2-like [Erpetoichthys calabaricus]XP_039593530.1 E3 ubiquitin-protein ligase znrf2-like [Polypterus senegalus]XP_051791643.1 E3 ubiquitin-protein ligase znrf2-like [Erpetoichthys calabaricus]